jgi:hypothetical protein
MRNQVPTAILLGLLATACQTDSPRYVTAAPTYPGSYIDARGNRIDAGTYYGTVDTPAQPLHRAVTTPPHTGGRGPVAWTDHGYSYDAWGNLISAPR